MEKTLLRVLAQDALKRLDVYLTERLPKFSRSFFKNLVEDQYVKVNNIIMTKSSYAVKPDDLIEVNFPSYEGIQILDEGQDLGVKIIFEHRDFLIVYKPAHLVVHKPSLKNKDLTLADWLIHNFKDMIHVGPSDRPGIVHRLDKDTSGIMIVAKNNYAHAIFGAMFKERKISKTYLAVVQGHPKPSGTIKEKISRDPLHINKMSARYDHGRDAVTHYRVIEYLKDSALVQVNPITGRTHQIRVHFAAIEHPLLGDALYGERSKLINRQALHAYRLSFHYEGVYYAFSIGLPQDMDELVHKLS